MMMETLTPAYLRQLIFARLLNPQDDRIFTEINALAPLNRADWRHGYDILRQFTRLCQRGSFDALPAQQKAAVRIGLLRAPYARITKLRLPFFTNQYLQRHNTALLDHLYRHQAPRLVVPPTPILLPLEADDTPFKAAIETERLAVLHQLADLLTQRDPLQNVLDVIAAAPVDPEYRMLAACLLRDLGGVTARERMLNGDRLRLIPVLADLLTATPLHTLNYDLSYALHTRYSRIATQINTAITAMPPSNFLLGDVAAKHKTLAEQARAQEQRFE